MFITNEKEGYGWRFLRAFIELVIEALGLYIIWNFVITELWMQAPFISIIQAAGLILLRQLVLKK